MRKSRLQVRLDAFCRRPDFYDVKVVRSKNDGEFLAVLILRGGDSFTQPFAEGATDAEFKTNKGRAIAMVLDRAEAAAVTV